jgi:hypothetical protein
MAKVALESITRDDARAVLAESSEKKSKGATRSKKAEPLPAEIDTVEA